MTSINLGETGRMGVGDDAEDHDHSRKTMILLGRPENKETFQATLNYKPVERGQCELRLLIKAL